MNADVYWGEDGTLAVVTTRQWADYLTGKSQDMPQEDVEEDCAFELSEQELLGLLTGNG